MAGSTKAIWFVQASSYFEKDGSHQLKLPSWVESLCAAFKNYGNIELAVAFQCDRANVKKYRVGAVTYYPISLDLENKLKRWLYKISHQIGSEIHEQRYEEIIEDFKPDLIQVFGSEFQFARLVSHAEIPVLLHIQSLVNPYLRKWFAGGINIWQVLRFSRISTLVKGSGVFHAYLRFRRQAKREKYVYGLCKYVTGRTEWDKRIVSMMARSSEYYHCDELLREQFFASGWQGNNHSGFKIVTVINPNLYKGLETMLLTAFLIKEYSLLSFEWIVVGFTETDDLVRITEKCQRIKSADVNMSYRITDNVEALVNEMKSSDLYVHCSHIENSSNALCEAMVLGMPIICTHAGGTESILDHSVEGLIVPPGDPYFLAAQILTLSNDFQMRLNLGAAARKRALHRHNPKRVVENLTGIYNQILSRE